MFGRGGGAAGGAPGGPAARPAARITGLGTAEPGFSVGLEETLRFAETWFGRRPLRPTPGASPIDTLDLVARLGVEERRLWGPLWEWGEAGSARPVERPALKERYRRFLDGALWLSARASRRALRQAGIRARDVDAAVVVCTSGPLLYNAASMLHGGVPEMESRMRRALGLPSGARLSPRAGLGTAGGVAGLRDAADLVRSGRARTVLVVAVELLSFVFGPAPDEPRRDPGRALASLFFGSVLADGAAAAVVRRGDGAAVPGGSSGGSSGGPLGEPVGGPGRVAGPEVAWGRSALWPRTEDYLRYEPGAGGFSPRIDPGLPGLVRERVAADFAQAVAAGGDRLGAGNEDPRRFAHLVHPHAALVLDAYAEALDLPEGSLDHSREVLRRHGNMAAPTIFFVLERFLSELASRDPVEGSTEGSAGNPARAVGAGGPARYADLSAIGPGIVSEHAFLEL